VALLGPAHPFRGGIAQYLALLYRALETRATVTQFSLSRQYPGFLFPGKSQKDDSEEPLLVPDEPVLDMLAPWRWPQAARRVAAWRPDGLVFKWWLPYFGPAYATVLRGAKRAGAVNVMIADNLIPHEKRPLDSLFTRWVTSATDAYIVMSESVEADLDRLAPGALRRRVPHPVYSQYASTLTREEARAPLGLQGDVVLFFGFVRHYKGLDTLLDAMPQILAKRKVTLVVAGEFYEPVAATKQRIERLGIGEHVRLYDRYLADEEVRRLFAAADVCALPYRSATQSGVIQIAYAAGCPVIITRVGGLPEFVAEGKSGYTVPPEDPAALAQAVLAFYDAGGRDRMAEGVRAQAALYSWDGLADSLLDLIMEARRRPRKAVA
jgi:glycosyltransferase involved in cell wall biosynthesis